MSTPIPNISGSKTIQVAGVTVPLAAPPVNPRFSVEYCYFEALEDGSNPSPVNFGTQIFTDQSYHAVGDPVPAGLTRFWLYLVITNLCDTPIFAEVQSSLGDGTPPTTLVIKGLDESNDVLTWTKCGWQANGYTF